MTRNTFEAKGTPPCTCHTEVVVACDCGANPENRWPHHDECSIYTAPPSAPVGVEDVVMAARNAENAIRNCAAAEQIGEGYVQYADDLRDAVQRLAQQPAAVDEAWLSKARSLYDRCSVFPETKPDGMIALLELRNHVYSILAAQPGGSDNDR